MAQNHRVLIVADDLTGAMDSAGPFAERGVETWVVAVPSACDPASLSRARVVSINTDSRHLPGPAAADRVRDIVRRLGAGYDIVFKKIDSTLRGNVVAETLAMMQACGRTAAVVAAAFPAQGRTMRGGVVHVNGVELARTDFARDALSPPPLQPLHEVFAAAAPRYDARSVVALTQPPGNHQIRVVDAMGDDDLARAVSTAKPQLGRVLLAGSAGLTRALAAEIFPVAHAPEARGGVDGAIVFAVGSRAARSREQVEALSAEPGTVVLSLPNGRADRLDFPAAGNLVLMATPDSGTPASAEDVAARLARGALDAARATHAQALVATGGDTAIAILAASGNPALHVLGDLMPGIPYARIRTGATVLWLVTKAGGFGMPETFREIARKLRVKN